MKRVHHSKWYNHKEVEHGIVIHKHSTALNIGTVNSTKLKSVTRLKTATSNSETLNLCNIKYCNIKQCNI